MTLTRRELGRLAAAALPACSLLAKPNSRFKGVQIGAITYSFRSLPSTAQDVLKYCTDSGISSIELMGDVAENYAGAPAMNRGPRPGGPPPQPAKGARRQPPSPEQQEAMKRAAEERTKWRLGVSMDKYKELRKMYNDAGVRIDVFKLPPTTNMSDDEVDYTFNVAKVMGANSLTMELPTSAEFTKRIGEFATKHKIYAGYHNHMQVNESSWETALSQSKYNSINLDVGHFTEAISGSPIPFIKKNAARITSFHLKDKKYGKNGGGNTIWGQGEVPLKEVLQLMAKEKHKWPANIELEYDIPEGSNVLAEMGKCVAYCRSALES